MLCCLKALIVKMKIVTTALLVKIEIFNGISLTVNKVRYFYPSFFFFFWSVNESEPSCFE